MKHYYIDSEAAKTPKKRPQVHASWCPLMKGAKNKAYIGLFADARKAVSVAREQGYEYVCGCPTCCPEASKALDRMAAAQ